MATDLLLYFKRVIKTQMCIILFSILGQLEFEFSFFLQSVLFFIGHVNIFLLLFFIQLWFDLWFSVRLAKLNANFWTIFTMHLWIGTVFLKNLVSDCMQYHPKNSSILYFHFDFSFFLCSSQLDDSALCRHWVFSPQSTLAVKRSSSGNVCCNESQCVTIGHNRSQYITLFYNMSQRNESQWITYRYNDFYIVLKCARMCHNVISSLENVYISFKRGEERRRWNFMFTKS